MTGEELDSSLHLDPVVGLSGNDPVDKAPPALLDKYGLSLDVLVPPFVTQHAPVRLDAQGSKTFFLSLLLSFTVVVMV